MTENLKLEPTKVTAAPTSNWWQTLPGVLTATLAVSAEQRAGIITGIAGLVAALHQAGLLPALKSISRHRIKNADKP